MLHIMALETLFLPPPTPQSYSLRLALKIPLRVPHSKFHRRHSPAPHSCRRSREQVASAQRGLGPGPADASPQFSSS